MPMYQQFLLVFGILVFTYLFFLWVDYSYGAPYRELARFYGEVAATQSRCVITELVPLESAQPGKLRWLLTVDGCNYVSYNGNTWYDRATMKQAENSAVYHYVINAYRRDRAEANRQKRLAEDIARLDS